MKKIKVLVISIISLIFVGIVCGVSCGIYFSLKNNVQKYELTNDLNKTQDFNNQLNFDYELSEKSNALINDAIQKSSSDTKLVYLIGWSAVFHKFGPIVHMFNVLNYNPNKNIDLYVKSNFYDLSNENTLTLKNMFPNLNIFVLDDSFQSRLYNDWKNILKSNLWSQLNLYNNFDFYCDDYFLLSNILYIYIYILDKNKVEFNPNEVINNYRFLYKANSINMFADGTASSNFYSNTMYELFVKLGNVTNNNESSFSNEKYNYFKSKILNNENIIVSKWSDFFMFFLPLITSYEKGNEIQKTKYFLPSTQMIVEMNGPNTSSLNYNEYNNNWFDPYNSLGSGLINACMNLPENYNLLINALLNASFFNKNEYIDKFNGYTNYIYVGRLLGNQNIIENEANKLINIYENFIDKNEPFKIFYKGHPRDNSDIKLKLINQIKSIKPELNPENWFDTLDQKVPFELYMSNGLLNDGNDYKVKIFFTYSTSILFFYNHNKDASIEKIFLSKTEYNDILKIFGPSSKIFSKEKIIIQE